MAAGGPTTDTAPQRRRAKSALFAIGCGWAGLAPHWLDPSLSLIPAITLAVLLGGYSVRSVLLPLCRPPQTHGLRWMWWWRPVMRRR